MDSDPIIPDVTDVIPPTNSGAIQGYGGSRLYPKGVSGNPAGRPHRKSLKEHAQEIPPASLSAFALHVYKGAMGPHSGTAVRYGQLFMEMLGESGASFRVAIEASGWTSFQSEVMAALLAAAPPEPAPPEIRTGPGFPPFPPSS